MAVRLNKTLEFAVGLASFAARFGIPVRAAAEMVAHAKIAKAAMCRYDTETADWHRREIEAAANHYGCVVTWSGLWPTVNKPGENSDLLPSMP